jgi:L-ascorbate metabolism protein UlaG (beta-lactamase superfamily)
MKTSISLILVIVTCALLLPHCVRSGIKRAEEGQPFPHSQQSEKTAHQTGGKHTMSSANFISATWEFLFAGKDRTPEGELPTRPVDLSHFNHRGEDQLRVTWLGHSSLLINIDGFKLLTDPVFEKKVSIVGPRRFSGEVPLEIAELPEIDAVIVSHDHYDHLNKFSIKQLKSKARRFIVPLGVGTRLKDWGVLENKIVELDWWQEHRLHGNLMVAATPAQHFSGRGLTDRNQTLWASWVIESQNHRLFFSGDSGYFDGFKKIGAVFGPFDMTFLECGAYNTAWSDMHMFPEQTVQAHLDLKGNLLHPIHWGTFNLSVHPWYDPMERLTAAAGTRSVSIATPMAGDTTIPGEYIPTARWWQPAMGDQEAATELLLPNASKQKAL